MSTFSQRHGLSPVRDNIQQGSIDTPLRNQIWNMFLAKWDYYSDLDKVGAKPSLNKMIKDLYGNFFEAPVDSIPRAKRSTYGNFDDITKADIRAWFFNSDYADCYNFVEFISKGTSKYVVRMRPSFNTLFQRYWADVRFINDILTVVTDEHEIKAIEQSLSEDTETQVREHLLQSLKLLSDRAKPDYRNSVKESISAVECQCRIMTGTNTLGDALKTLSKNNTLPKALSKGWENLYGWSSGKGGIRHALMEEDTLDADMAKYFLSSCAGFINLLKTR